MVKITRAVARRILIGFALVVLMNLLVVGLYFKGVLTEEQNFFNDQLMSGAADRLDLGTIVIASVDDASLQRYGRLETWDRSHYADLIVRLKDAGARVLALDLSFPEPNPGDDKMAAAIDYAMYPKDGSAPMPVIIAHPGQGLPNHVADKGLEFAAFDTLSPSLARGRPILAGVNLDPDGATVRDLPLLYYSGSEQYLPLSLLAASAFAQRLPGFTSDLEFSDDPFRLRFGPYSIPIDQYFRMPIYFFSKPTGYHRTAYSLSDIADGRVAPEALRNRLVMAGPYGATGLADDYPVPTSVDSKMDSVEIFANATQSLIQGKFITNQSAASTFAIMFALSLLAALVFARGGALGVIATIVIALAYSGIRVGIARGQFFSPAQIGQQQLIELPNLAYNDAALILSSGALYIFLFISEQRRRSIIYSTFSRYITPAVAQQLSSMSASGELGLGGTRRVATIMFGNLYLPHVHAEDMLRLLNRYFDGMVRIVNQNGGTVNKFIGDHIMVMFNVPLDLPDHATKAVRSAMESIAWLEDTLAASPGEEASFGVGINSGQLVAGNMGSKNRMEYTVLGDTVNTASRLSGVASHEANEVIISQATLDLMDGSGVKVKDRGEVFVKGKKEPIHVYQVLGFGEPGPAQIAVEAAAAG